MVDACGAYVPTGHAVGLDDGSVQLCPAGHTTQLLDPDEFVYLPDEHGTQVTSPTEL